MDDTDELGALRQTITATLEECKNLDILDLIYKLLINELT